MPMEVSLTQLKDQLEAAKHEAEGVEFWTGREIMPILDYHEWRNFQRIIRKAQAACVNSGQRVEDHFLEVETPAEKSSPSNRRQRHRQDFLLTRYACYLVAQSGNPYKPVVAQAQTYFAVQTRRRELAGQRSEDTERLEARQNLKETESRIEGTVYRRGIRSSADFSSFKNRHIKALYGGLTVREVKERRGIPTHRSLADFDSHVELRAKDFSLAMTDHNIRKKNIVGKQHLEREVVENSLATRDTLLNRGIKPEELPAEEDLREVEKRLEKQERFLGDGLKKKLKEQKK